MSDQPVQSFVSWAQQGDGWTADQIEAWRGEVYAFAALLRAGGVLAELDLLHLHEPIDWTRFGESQIRQNDQILAVLSKEWRERWEGRNAPTDGPGAVAEANALRSIFQRDQNEFLRRVKLVLLPNVDESSIPDGLHGIPRFRVSEFAPAGIADLLGALKNKPSYPTPPIGQPPPAPVSTPAEPLQEQLDSRDASRLELIDQEISVILRALASFPTPTGREAPSTASLDVQDHLKSLESQRKSLVAASGMRKSSGSTQTPHRTSKNAMPGWLELLELPRTVKHPTGVAIDGDTIYVVDREGGAVVRMKNNKMTASVSGLQEPYHAAAHDGLVLVSDAGANRIKCYNRDLREIASRSRSRYEAYRLQRPHGVSWRAGNDFYIANTDAHSVMRITRNKLTDIADSTEGGGVPDRFAYPCGIACTHDAVVVADTFHHRVQVYTSDLKFETSFGEFGVGLAQFAYPVGVVCWQDYVVVADQSNQRLQLWQRSSATEAAGQLFVCRSSDLCGGWIGTPFGLAFSTYGELFATDRKNGRVLKIDFGRLLDEELRN